MADNDVTHLPDSEEHREALQISASIAVSTMTPQAGIEAPTMVQIKLTPPNATIELVFETPDPAFLRDLCSEIILRVEEMEKNPNNAEYIGKHDTIDPQEFDAKLRAAVEAAQAGDASNNPGDASPEKE